MERGANYSLSIFFMNWTGVTPVLFLNERVKETALLYPTLSAIA